MKVHLVGGEVPLLTPSEENVNKKLHETIFGGGWGTFIESFGSKVNQKILKLYLVVGEYIY